MDPLSDAKVIDSWQKNAEPWTTAVREGQIASRTLVTNQAILDAVQGVAPRSVLDIGCGEGWLSHALQGHGVHTIGVDVVPALIDRARAGGGDFRVMSYEAIARGELDVRVDAIVVNFAFIGKDSVEGVVPRVPALLNEGGALIIQTIHPLVATGDEPYIDGWRHGSWAGFSEAFTDPAPWYFRTLESWVRLLTGSGLVLRELREPFHPATGKPASVILIAQLAG